MLRSLRLVDVPPVPALLRVFPYPFIRAVVPASPPGAMFVPPLRVALNVLLDLWAEGRARHRVKHLLPSRGQRAAELREVAGELVAVIRAGQLDVLCHRMSPDHAPHLGRGSASPPPWQYSL